MAARGRLPNPMSRPKPPQAVAERPVFTWGWDMGLGKRTQSPMRLRASGSPAALARHDDRDLVWNPLETSKNRLTMAQVVDNLPSRGRQKLHEEWGMRLEMLAESITKW